MPLLQKKRYRPNHAGLYVPLPSGGGPFTFISGISDVIGGGGNAAGGSTLTPINTTGAGLLIFAASYFSGATGLSMTDSKGNTWTALTVASSASTRCNIWYSIPTSVGTGHTASLTGTDVYASRYFAAFAFGAASPADQQSQANGSSSSAAGSSVTPGFNDELVITAVAVNDSGVAISSVNGGFTIIDDTITPSSGNYIGGGAAYLIQTTAAAAAPTWTLGSSAQWAVKMATFKVS